MKVVVPQLKESCEQILLTITALDCIFLKIYTHQYETPKGKAINNCLNTLTAANTNAH